MWELKTCFKRTVVAYNPIHGKISRKIRLLHYFFHIESLLMIAVISLWCSVRPRGVPC